VPPPGASEFARQMYAQTNERRARLHQEAVEAAQRAREEAIAEAQFIAGQQAQVDAAQVVEAQAQALRDAQARYYAEQGEQPQHTGHPIPDDASMLTGGSS
jgi:hypothetical protein